jgi:hypothetical protein
MRNLFILLLLIACSCENRSFDSDKRQLIAKDEIRRQIRKAQSFDITGFKEDTSQNYNDTNIKHPLRYLLDFVYTDSTGRVQKKKGVVVFTSDGTSVINSHITDEN